MTGCPLAEVLKWPGQRAAAGAIRYGATMITSGRTAALKPTGGIVQNGLHITPCHTQLVRNGLGNGWR